MASRPGHAFHLLPQEPAALRSWPVGQAELTHGHLSDGTDGFLGGVGHTHPCQILRSVLGWPIGTSSPAHSLSSRLFEGGSPRRRGSRPAVNDCHHISVGMTHPVARAVDVLQAIEYPKIPVELSQSRSAVDGLVGDPDRGVIHVGASWSAKESECPTMLPTLPTMLRAWRSSRASTVGRNSGLGPRASTGSGQGELAHGVACHGQVLSENGSVAIVSGTLRATSQSGP